MKFIDRRELHLGHGIEEPRPNACALPFRHDNHATSPHAFDFKPWRHTNVAHRLPIDKAHVILASHHPGKF